MALWSSPPPPGKLQSGMNQLTNANPIGLHQVPAAPNKPQTNQSNQSEARPTSNEPRTTYQEQIDNQLTTDLKSNKSVDQSKIPD